MLISAWEDYIEQLCEEHDDLLQTPNRRAFIRYGADDPAIVASKLKSPYVRHASFYFGGYEGSSYQYTSTLLFLANVNSEQNLEAKIQEARNITQVLVEDFDARIQHDAETGVTCELFGSISECQVEAIGMVDQSAYGWEYTITIFADKPAYNSLKWNQDAP